MKLYNFNLSGFMRRDSTELEKKRREKIKQEDSAIGANDKLLYLVGPEGFVDVQFAPFRAYSIDEIKEDASAIYIASATKADKFTMVTERIRLLHKDFELAEEKRQSGDEFWRNIWTEDVYKERLGEYIREAEEKLQAYLNSMRKVETSEIVEILKEIKVEVKYTENYEACRIESEVKFIPDMYEIIVVANRDSKLFHKEFTNDSGEYQRVLKKLKEEEKYTESYTVV